jgi:adenosylhomocysteine nucleosidase
MAIGIVGATEQEMDVLTKNIEIADKVKKTVHTYYKGKMSGKAVVVTISGIGKINTALTTQTLIDDFGVDRIIFTGVAGSLDPQLEVGDVVVSNDCIQHDVDMMSFGLQRGQFLFSDFRIFEADKDMVQLAYDVSKRLGFKTVKGRILSGDQFITDIKQAQSLQEELGGHCIEMEGAALAYVCTINDIPFVVIRHISDKADRSADVDFMEFCKHGAKNSYRILTGMLDAL